MSLVWFWLKPRWGQKRRVPETLGRYSDNTQIIDLITCFVIKLPIHLQAAIFSPPTKSHQSTLVIFFIDNP